MHITFHGAAQTVTGSCHLVETHDGCRFLIDCGMAQGGQEADEHNENAFAFDPTDIDFVLLTHAHIDHSGLLPKLAAKGFRGPIYCTLATKDLLEVLLKDSAHIQQVEYERDLKRQQSGGKQHLRGDGSRARRDIELPLYTLAHVARAMEQVKAEPYSKAFAPHPSVKVCMRDAGHILGSAILEIWVDEGNGKTCKLVASGDLGQPGRVILRDPTHIDEADVLLIESTYGDRNHKDLGSTLDELVAVVNDIAPRGNIVIPAFAVGRTQELLYHFLQLAQQGRLGNVEIFVDSPMAVSATEITLRHFSIFDEEAKQLLGSAKQLMDSNRIHFISDVEDSIKLNRIKSGAVIISASGMCDAGRVLHHLRNNLGRPECAVVICGFQTQGSLGRRLVDGVKHVRMFGEDIDVRASVHTLGGFSAHADQSALLEWTGAFKKKPLKTFVVHGEPDPARILAGELHQRFGLDVVVPEEGERFSL